jgi:hypothetical protein
MKNTESVESLVRLFIPFITISINGLLDQINHSKLMHTTCNYSHILFYETGGGKKCIYRRHGNKKRKNTTETETENNLLLDDILPLPRV